MGSYFGNPKRRKQCHEPLPLQPPSCHCCHTHLTRQSKRCLLSELLKTTFPVPLQELMFPSSSLQMFHLGGNLPQRREDLEQCLQEGLISQSLCRGILVFVQPASLQAQSTRDPGDKQHSSQHRELPWEYQWGLKGNIPAGRFSCSEMSSIWDLPHPLPMSSCLQIAPKWDLFVRPLPIQAVQQLQSCPVWFYASGIQLVFLHTGIAVTQQQLTQKTFLSPPTQA